jgi:hypothetical protein
MGILEVCPRIFVEKSTVVTSLRIRGLNQILKQSFSMIQEGAKSTNLWKAAWFSRFVISSSAAEE